MNQEWIFSNAKFHQVFGKNLSVALEATLEVGSGELEFDNKLFGDKPNPALLFRKGDCWRVYFPALKNGDLQKDNEASVSFVPWFEGPNVLYYRLCFRATPIFGHTLPWIMFGRFSEEKPFGFQPEKPFINLDFFSQSGSFKPLYVKLIGNNEDFVYFVIEGEWKEEGPLLKLKRIKKEDAPSYLQAAKP